MSDTPVAKKAPSIGLPKGSETCEVSIVNTTCDITVTPHMLVEPDIPGHEWLNLPTSAFLLKHKATGSQVLFDMGCRKDWQNSVPHIVDLVSNHVPGIRIQKDIGEILQEGGVQTSALKSVILSHWHFDHSGDISKFPTSVDLLVGPGFKDEFLPGYPTKETSPFWEAEFKGRQVIEVPFTDSLKIGKFQAHDYFGDGSLYILNVPGHAIGHISALVRTTPETAIFLGGDVCHFTGDIRPSDFMPMPDPIPGETVLDRRIPHPCPCALFTACHPDQKNSRTAPFYKLSTHPTTFYVDPPTATNSLYALMEFDADPNILVCIAHDPAPLDLMNFFPDGTINDWQKKNWKEKLHWHFLNEMPIDGKTGRPKLVDGLYKDGAKVRGLIGE